MKKITQMAGLGFAVVWLAAGCSKSADSAPVVPQGKSDSAAVQGKWKGQEPGETKGLTSLILADGRLEFHGADTNEWYKGTFTLHEDKQPKQMIVKITECPFPEYVGKTANAIYQIKNGEFTIAANEPGNPEMPKTFAEQGLRTIVFKMDK